MLLKTIIKYFIETMQLEKYNNRTNSLKEMIDNVNSGLQAYFKYSLQCYYLTKITSQMDQARVFLWAKLEELRMNVIKCLQIC